ncbi:hypothetical protein CXB51_003865 [Gossypium anomalum]|uniref:Reverse transcriptase Ty1/copia-type domain-containing protein n=1 Tax=Gossypium anomalum TaxID=47600 RepID=A0A8J6DDZ7_9ROSI|nr:hypothetical protein CXB51_003865 [Gossypium anomalum]
MVLPHHVGLDTSAQIWNALVNLYVNQTTSRLMFYRRALHSQRKADLFMKEFLMKIKGFCDSLASCGEVISEREHVTTILNNLLLYNESTITIITASEVPYTIQGVTSMLLDAEARQQLTMLETPSSANMCYYRFDASYKSAGYRPPSSPQVNVCMFGNGPPLLTWTTMSTPIALTSSQPGWFFPPAPAYIATPDTIGDNAWYPDSSVTHHLTNSAASLSERTPYNGPGKVYGVMPVITSYSFTTVIHEISVTCTCSVRFYKPRVLLRGSVHNGLYRLSLPGLPKAALSSDPAQCFTTTATVPLSIWHFRLGHPCKATLTTALHHFLEYVKPLQLVVADVWGPAPIPSNGFCYYVAFTDAKAERTLGCKLLALQLDGGGEFQVLKCCLCFPNLRPYNKCKLQFRSSPCTFLGYSPQRKGYRCQDSSGRIYISRLVIFNKSIFPFKNISPQLIPYTSLSQSSSKLLVLLPDSLSTTSTNMASFNLQDNDLTTMPLSNSPRVGQPLNLSPLDPPPPLPSVPYNSHVMVTRSKAGIFKPKVYLSKAICFSSDTHVDIHKAMCSECWQTVVHSELQVLLYNNTWSLCSLLVDRRAIRCKWLFKVKKKADGIVERYKARLVAKGFSQHAGQVDVNNTFLNGDLTEEIYMDQPSGFEVPGSSSGQKLVCRLNKVLYGLRQALRAWFHTLKQYLVAQLSFHASKADSSLFIRESSRNVLLLMAYVDDIVITGSSSKAIDDVVTRLHSKFALKDMGRLSFFLGIKVQHTSQGLLLGQRKYISEILHKIGMVGAAATPIPMVSTLKLAASDGSPPFANVHLYPSIVGML